MDNLVFVNIDTDNPNSDLITDIVQVENGISVNGLNAHLEFTSDSIGHENSSLEQKRVLTETSIGFFDGVSLQEYIQIIFNNGDLTKPIINSLVPTTFFFGVSFNNQTFTGFNNFEITSDTQLLIKTGQIDFVQLDKYLPPCELTLHDLSMYLHKNGSFIFVYQNKPVITLMSAGYIENTSDTGGILYSSQTKTIVVSTEASINTIFDSVPSNATLIGIRALVTADFSGVTGISIEYNDTILSSIPTNINIVNPTATTEVVEHENIYQQGNNASLTILPVGASNFNGGEIELEYIYKYQKSFATESQTIVNLAGLSSPTKVLDLGTSQLVYYKIEVTSDIVGSNFTLLNFQNTYDENNSIAPAVSGTILKEQFYFDNFINELYIHPETTITSGEITITYRSMP